MLSKTKLLVLAALLFSVPVFADSISVGYISNLSDSPTGGEQQLTINNLTGAASCYSLYPACTNLNFTDWTLTVDYTSDYYNGTGPSEPAPLVFTDAGSSPYGGFGDILAGSSLSFDFDLCAGSGSCANPDDPDTQITSVEFSGQISPSSFCLYDPTVPGCNPSDPTTFFADPNFDMVWNASSPGGSPYVDEDLFTYAPSPDITVSEQQQLPPNTTPEPGTFFLLAALLPFTRFARRSKVDRRS